MWNVSVDEYKKKITEKRVDDETEWNSSGRKDKKRSKVDEEYHDLNVEGNARGIGK